MKLAAAIVAAIVLTAPHAAAKGPPLQVFGFVQHGSTYAFAKLGATTLEPIAAQARIGRGDPSFVALVRGGGRAAVADGWARLAFVDLYTMRMEFRVAYPGRPAAALWNFADRLVTLNQTSTGGVILVDPMKRRVTSVRSLGGSVAAYAVAPTQIVALIAPLQGIGSVKLAVIEDRGGVRTVPLPQIRAGTETVGLDDGALHRFEYPALAVDRTRAVVIAADGTTVEVALDTLATTTRVLSRSPAASRKNATGSMRVARWVSQYTIAVTGADASVDTVTGQHMTPAGLTLIDTRDWSARRVDSESIGLAGSPFGAECIGCGGVILTYAQKGLNGYSADGRLLYTIFPDKSVAPPAVIGQYTYVGTGTRFTIVDTYSGKVVTTAETRLPTIVVSQALY